MTQFLICFGILGLFAVPFILVFAICGVDTAHKVGGSAMILAFWRLISVAMVAEAKWDTDL